MHAFSILFCETCLSWYFDVSTIFLINAYDMFMDAYMHMLYIFYLILRNIRWATIFGLIYHWYNRYFKCRSWLIFCILIAVTTWIWSYHQINPGFRLFFLLLLMSFLMIRDFFFPAWQGWTGSWKTQRRGPSKLQVCPSKHLYNF